MIGHIYIYVYIYINYKQIHVGDLGMCIFRNLQDTTNMGKLQEAARTIFSDKVHPRSETWNTMKVWNLDDAFPFQMGDVQVSCAPLSTSLARWIIHDLCFER